MNYKKAKKTAEEILQKHNINKPIVNVFEIAKNEGLKIKFVEMTGRLEDVAGFYDDQSKTIFVNNADTV